MIGHPSRARTAITVFVLAVALTGCATAPAQLKDSAAERLQSGVQDVTASAATGDLAGARSALGDLQADLLAAAAAGEVTGQRSAQIQSAINLVDADLDAAIEASKPVETVAPAPEPIPTPTPTKDAKPGKGDGKDGDEEHGKDKDD